MSLGASFYEEGKHTAAARAIEFLTDPHASAREYLGDNPSMTDCYPYTIGVAMATIEWLLDALGFCELGPDRFDCEWSVTHPYVDYTDDDSDPF